MSSDDDRRIERLEEKQGETDHHLTETIIGLTKYATALDGHVKRCEDGYKANSTAHFWIFTIVISVVGLSLGGFVFLAKILFDLTALLGARP